MLRTDARFIVVTCRGLGLNERAFVGEARSHLGDYRPGGQGEGKPKMGVTSSSL